MGNLCNCCCLTKPKDIPEHLFTHTQDRRCTDILFLLGYVAFWVVSIIIFISAASSGGSPNKILRGNDWMGRTCGKSDGVEDKPLAAWPWPKVSSFTASQIKICVSDCAITESLSNATGVEIVTPHRTKKVFAYCLPIPNNPINGSVNVDLSGDFAEPGNRASQLMADMLTAWPVILISSGVALLMSWAYVKTTRCFAGIIVWLVVLLIAAAGGIFGFAMYKKANAVKDTGVDYVDSETPMKAMAFTIWAGTFVFVCVIFFIRDRIEIAVELTKEGSRAIDDMSGLVIFPVFPFLLMLAYAVFWIAQALYMFSVSDFKDNAYPTDFLNDASARLGPSNVWAQRSTDNAGNFKNFEFQFGGFKYLFIFHFFALLWNMEFLIYFTYLVTAGAIANWYFTPRAGGDRSTAPKKRGEGREELSLSPVWASVKRTLFWHTGTVAFASLVVGLCELIRATVLWIAEKAKGDKPNACQRCILGSLTCCLKCVTCCLEKISKHAIVWTAIWGDSFIVACCSSFKLIWDNLDRVAAITIVSGFLMLLGKALVALLVTGISGLIMQGIYGDELSSIIMPCVVIFILSFVVASMFMSIFEITLDCIFICFLVDEYNFGGTDQMYAHPDLEKVINKYQTASQKRANAIRNKGNVKAAQADAGAAASNSATSTGSAATSTGVAAEGTSTEAKAPEPDNKA